MSEDFIESLIRKNWHSSEARKGWLEMSAELIRAYGYAPENPVVVELERQRSINESKQERKKNLGD